MKQGSLHFSNWFLAGILVVIWFFIAMENQCFASSELILKPEQQHYHLNALSQASGFFPLGTSHDSEHIVAKIKANPSEIKTTVTPDFSKDNQVGFFISIYNDSGKRDWMLHISRLLIDGATVYVRSEDGEQKYVYDFTQSKNQGEILSIMGRGIVITLPTNEFIDLYIELAANSHVPPVYLGLMTDTYYTSWIKKYDTLFDVGLGVIAGLIITAFLGAFIIRNSTLLWFAISSALLVVMTILRSHYGDVVIQTVDGGPPSWTKLYIAATSASLLVFAGKFLSIYEESSTLNTIFIWSARVTCAIGIGTLFLSHEAGIQILIPITILNTFLALYAGATKMYSKGSYYILFMLGWLPIFLIVFQEALVKYSSAEPGEVTLSYLLVTDIYAKIVHMLFHFCAVMVKLLALKQEKLATEAHSEAKTTFLASVSHDLRQPLQTMKLLLDQLEDQPDNHKRKHIIDKINQVHAATDDAFSGLMDWSQLEAGKMHVHSTAVDIDLLFNALRAEFIDLAKVKQLRLRIRPTRIMLETDPVLLRRILRNLLSNAIKYTVRGGVLLAAKQRQSGVIFEVWDTGCGVSDEDQSRIFNFYARSASTQSNQTGTGVGLANAKLIAEALGMRVTMQSKLNKGSVLRVFAPVVDRKTEKLKNDGVNNQRDIKSRVFNNISDAELAKTVDHYLQSWGYTTTNVHPVSHAFIILTDDLTSIERELTNRHDCLVGLYGLPETNTKTAIEDRKHKNIHRLSQKCSPAELRAFIRYAEMHSG
jgi:signal transduction histidine kinase